MKLLWIFFFSLCSSFLHGQYYVKGLADQQIDQLDILQKDARLAYEFVKAKEYFDSLSNHWLGVLDDTTITPSKGDLQNYFYCKIGLYRKWPKVDFGEGKLSTSQQIDHLKTLKLDIQKEFSSEHYLWALYYGTLAELFKSNREYNLSKDSFFKAIEILEKKDSMVLERSILLRGLAGVDFTLRNNEEAMVIYKKVIEMRESMHPVDSVNLAYSYYDLGRCYERNRDFENNAYCWEKTADIFLSHYGPTNEVYLIATKGLGIIFSKTQKYKKAIETFQTVCDGVKTNPELNVILLGSTMTSIASCYTSLNEYDKAKSIYTEVIDLYKVEKITKGLYRLYNNLSRITKPLSERIVYLEKALELCESDPSCNEESRAITLVNLGIDYCSAGNIHKGLNYYHKSLEISESNKQKFSMRTASIYSSLASAYQKLGDDQQALLSTEKALEQHILEDKENIQKMAFYQANLAQIHINLRQFGKAKALLESALKNLDISKDNEFRYSNSVYGRFSTLYTHLKDYDKALLYRNKNISELEQVLGKRTRDAIAAQNQKALIFSKMGEIDSSRMVLSKCYEEVGLGNILAGGDMNYSISKKDLWLSFTTLNWNMETEFEMGDFQDLEVLTRKMEVGCKLIDDLRQSHYFESSEQNFMNTTSKFFNRGIDLLSIFYDKDPSETTLALIFKCIEKSKSIAINRSFERVNSIMEKGVPVEIIKREKKIISKYEQSFSKRQDYLKEGKDDLAKDESVFMFELQFEKDQFLDSLKRSFPVYFEKRYSQTVIKIADFQQLAKKHNRGFLQYHWTDSLLCKIFILPDEIIFSFENKSEVLPALNQLYLSLVERCSLDNESLFYSNRKVFLSNSIKAFQLLIGDEVKEKLPVDLSVIPDGILVYLPFELLLDKVVDENTAYRSMPYILYNHTISYVGSAYQYAMLQDQETKSYPKKYIGFAPSYEGSIETTRGSNTKQLLYNEDEVRSASTMFKGDQRLGANATETFFKSSVANYEIAHLAMHAIVDDRYPMDSYLLFSDEQGGEDGKLYVHEISEMELQNNLVVLSACETNRGEELKGEGLLGISRAFQIASCPNLIVSNWLVDDNSASKIMKYFFDNISQQESAASSLRKAKLRFLENAAEINAHPSYWSAFSFHGNPNQYIEVKNESSRMLMWIVGILFFLFISIGAYKMIAN